MKLEYFSILLAVLSNSCYHLFQKSTPSNLNPIAALIVTYACALFVSITVFFIFVPGVNLIESIRAVNWASILLGFAVVGLELGFLLAYRSGWNISIAGFLANTLVALLLIPVGVLFYKEKLSIINISGFLLCVTGLFLVSRR